MEICCSIGQRSMMDLHDDTREVWRDPEDMLFRRDKHKQGIAKTLSRIHSTCIGYLHSCSRFKHSCELMLMWWCNHDVHGPYGMVQCTCNDAMHNFHSTSPLNPWFMSLIFFVSWARMCDTEKTTSTWLTQNGKPPQFRTRGTMMGLNNDDPTTSKEDAILQSKVDDSC
jgi:hypothetical protein